MLFFLPFVCCHLLSVFHKLFRYPYIWLQSYAAKLFQFNKFFISKISYSSNEKHLSFIFPHFTLSGRKLLVTFPIFLFLLMQSCWKMQFYFPHKFSYIIAIILLLINRISLLFTLNFHHFHHFSVYFFNHCFVFQHKRQLFSIMVCYYNRK